MGMGTDPRGDPGLPRSLAEVLESMGDAFVALDREWRCTYLNRRAAELVGRPAEDVVGQSIWEVFPEAAGQPFHQASEQALREQRPLLIEQHFPPWDRWFENRIYPTPDGLSIFFQDVTERRQAATELSRSEERYRTLVHAVATVVWRSDGVGRQLESRSWDTLTGRPVTTSGQDADWIETVHPDDRDAVLAAWDDALARGDVYDETYRVQGSDGGWRHVRARGVPVRENGEIREWIGVIFDVTEQARAEEALRRAALEDALTGLPNRTGVVARLEAALARRDPRVAALYIDIDNFKAVNDALGHIGGDELLRRVAGAVRACIRPADVVGRLAGDEFLVVCEDLHDADEAFAIGRRVTEAVRAAGDPQMPASASVGIALCHGAPIEVDELLRAADTALYQAKSAGGHRVEVFGEALRARLRQRELIERELVAGCEGLRLHFQPIVWFDGRPPSVEALLRWQRPGGPALPAADAISVAEESGLIIPIGGRILRAACEQAAAWRDAGRPVPVSVNVSARQIARGEELLAAVRDTLEETGLEPALLRVEVTESVLMRDMGHGERVLRALREHGIRVKIDDFGVGWSSLSYLHRLPVDAVKIDRSFVAALDDGGGAIVEAVVGMARAFGVQVVAEGVERPEQLEAVRAAGCDGVQGFLLARPAPAEDAVRALDAALAIAG